MNKGNTEILELFTENENSALQYMFDRYYSGLCAIACLYLDDPDEAEDVVQQVFIKFWEEKHYQNVSGSLNNYLNVAVKNRCINQLKKTNRLKPQNGNYPDEEQLVQAFDFITQEEEQAVFRKALKALPEQSRKSLELVYFSGKSYKGAAETLNVSVNTIKSHLKNALRNLKNSPVINSYFREKKNQN